jgi:hypothetical protein
VDDGVVAGGGEDAFESVDVGGVDGVRHDVAAAQGLGAAQGGGGATGEVVHDVDLVTGLQQGEDDVGADVPGASRDQDVHHGSPRIDSLPWCAGFAPR